MLDGREHKTLKKNKEVRKVRMDRGGLERTLQPATSFYTPSCIPIKDKFLVHLCKII
jgi:hypothetical protein